MPVIILDCVKLCEGCVRIEKSVLQKKLTFFQAYLCYRNKGDISFDSNSHSSLTIHFKEKLCSKEFFIGLREKRGARLYLFPPRRRPLVKIF